MQLNECLLYDYTDLRKAPQFINIIKLRRISDFLVSIKKTSQVDNNTNVNGCESIITQEI